MSAATHSSGEVHFVRGSDALAEAASGFAAPMRLLGELHLQVTDAGSPYAAVYIEGARGALRHALAAVLADVATSTGASAWPMDGAPFALGMGDLALRRSGGPLSVRGRLCRQGEAYVFEEDREADLDEQAPEPGLPEEMLADQRLRRLAHGPAFSALLAAALGHHRWVHLATGRTASLDVPTARVVVSILSGGRPLHGWPHSVSADLLDAEVAGELARLGWRRLVSPEPSGDSLSRSCRTRGLAVPAR